MTFVIGRRKGGARLSPVPAPSLRDAPSPRRLAPAGRATARSVDASCRRALARVLPLRPRVPREDSNTSTTPQEASRRRAAGGASGVRALGREPDEATELAPAEGVA